LKDVRALEPLIAALNDADELVRASAVVGLAALKETKATDALIGLLQTDKDKYLRRQAASSLGTIGDKRAVDPLISELDSDGVVLWDAAHSLGQLGDSRAVGPLIAALAREVDEFFPNGIKHVAWALGQLGDRQAVGRLSLARNAIQSQLQFWTSRHSEDSVTMRREAIESIEEALGHLGSTNAI